jgi:large subunit ribosomal protein L23
METNLKTKYAGLLKSPRVTEKASFLMEKNVYTFEIAPKTNKKEVASAVKAFYGVTPIRVNIVKTPAKKVFVRGKRGSKSAIKKAYVFLKKGDKLE